MRGSKYWASSFIKTDDGGTYLDETLTKLEYLLKQKGDTIRVHIARTIANQAIVVRKKDIKEYGEIR